MGRLLGAPQDNVQLSAGHNAEVQLAVQKETAEAAGYVASTDVSKTLEKRSVVLSLVVRVSGEEMPCEGIVELAQALEASSAVERYVAVLNTAVGSGALHIAKGWLEA